MELVIQTKDFTVRVDTESKLREGDIMCGYVKDTLNPQDNFASLYVPAYWYLTRITSKNLGNFFTIVDKHYKVLEILKSKNEKEI
jgi:hypothetical protein